MAAPTPSTRSQPTGWKMPDGFSTTLSLSLNQAINFWEVTVKPPGMDGAEAINTTTMLNILWRTFAPRHLQTLTEVTVTAAYDPDVIGTDLISMINIAQTVTVHFPDHSSIAFYAYIQKYEHEAQKEGEFPQITLTIVPTNYDPVNKVEAGPVFTPASGT